MKCLQCGHDMSDGARFCGKCGMVVEKHSEVSRSCEVSDPGVRQLSERLTALARALQESGTPAFITNALETLAAGPNAAGHLTAVVGEKGRGKTTLVNRLLGVQVLPTGRQGYRSAVALRNAPSWQTVGAEGNAMPATLPIPPGLAIASVDGPPAILKHTTLLDTPPLNEVDINFEERVVAELVHADAFLVCVSATQLLSQNERDLIRRRLLPLLGGDGALVVTHTDRLETAEDRQDIEARTRRFAGQRLAAFFLSPGQEGTPEDLVRFIEDSARNRSKTQATIWRRKVSALLRGIEQELAEAPPAEEPATPAAPAREERIHEFQRILESEHSLALAESESTLRQRMGALRIGLSERVAHWTPEYAQNEGISEVTADVQTALREAVQLYVSSLEQSLTSAVPRSIQLAAEHVGTIAPALAGSAGCSEPEVAKTERKKDLRVPILAVAGVGLLFVSSAVAPVAAVAALFMSHQLRRERDEAFDRRVRSDAMEALSSWIAEAEPELIQQLRQAVRPVVDGLMTRVESVVESAAPARKSLSPRELLSLTRECLVLASDDGTSHMTSEVKS